MPYLVTLDDYTPTARLADAGVWTQARFQYAATRSGTWTTIATEALDPVETDPTDPLSRDFDVIVPDVGYPGWLRVVFLDVAGNQEPTEPIFVGSSIRPAVLEVANLMPDRTTIDGGTEAGTFTTGTTPTAAQVDALIDLVLDTVEPEVLADADTEIQRRWRSIVALNAAILTETSYFSHQGEINEARVAVWERLIDRQDGITTSTGGSSSTPEGDQSLQVGTVQRSATQPWTWEIVTESIKPS